MKFKAFFIVIVFHSLLFSQSINFNSPQNIKFFGDYLFCEKDYLRAIDEYQRFLAFNQNDTVRFKIAFGFQSIGDYRNAIDKFSGINSSSKFYELAQIEKSKSYFLSANFSSLISQSDSMFNSKNEYSVNSLKLKYLSFLLLDQLPEKTEFLSPFNDKEKNQASVLYNLKNAPPYKSEILAGILSTIIPGAGKIYTENYGDGITALILTGLFGYLAYTNFEHHHDFRAWTFTGIGTLFYTGNIYGSIASAQIFNAKVNFVIDSGIKLFLEDNNYFVPEYDFCK